jgi:hypothetical protein
LKAFILACLSAVVISPAQASTINPDRPFTAIFEYTVLDRTRCWYDAYNGADLGRCDTRAGYAVRDVFLSESGDARFVGSVLEVDSGPYNSNPMRYDLVSRSGRLVYFDVSGGEVTLRFNGGIGDYGYVSDDYPEFYIAQASISNVSMTLLQAPATVPAPAALSLGVVAMAVFPLLGWRNRRRAAG